MNKKLIAATFLTAFGTVFWSCDSDTTQKGTTAKAPEIKEPVMLESPAFIADSAYKYTATQVGFGPRIPNTEAHRKTGDYLIQKLKDFGAEVTVQEFEMMAFDGTMLQMRNIIGRSEERRVGKERRCG